MYIAFETLPGNDPRLDKDYRIVDVYWHYTIAEVPDNKYLEWLNHIVLTKEEADASFFTGSNNNEITIKKPPKGSKKIEFVGYSFIEEDQGDKQLYHLTDKDKANCISMMKKILSNYVENHTTSIKEIGALKKIINSATSIDVLNRYLGEYFDTLTPGINVDDLQPALTIKTLKTQEED